MTAVLRMTACFICLWVTLAASSDLTPEEILASEAVLDDFLNAYGDDPNQNALGAAKGVIENGKGKAYMGEGYWFTYCDSRGSKIQNPEGKDIGASNFKDAIDAATNSLNLVLSRVDTTYDSYVGFGCNLLKEKTYVDLSKMTAFTIKAKGSGKLRLNFITKDYIEANEEWGFYGAEISLSSGDYKDIVISKSDIEPAEWSYGYKNDLTWANDGSKAVTKIQFELKTKATVDISIKKITFTGMTYADFGFIPLSVASSQSKHAIQNILSVKNSKVSYTLNQPQRLSIALFDATGCRVATIFNGNADAGNHIVNLDNGIANGNYVIMLRSEQGQKAVEPVRIVK